MDSSQANLAEFLGLAEHCLVCGDEADGFHYGVRSCRGCNAFFRRAITFNMQYRCRRGGNCKVDKNARCACRACRLQKCEDVGMDRRAVQPKRDANGPNSISLSAMDVLIAPTPPPKIDPFDPNSLMPELPPIPPVSNNFLMKMTFEYAEQKKRRHAMLCTSLEEILSEETGDVRGVASPEDLSSIFKAQIILLFEWANNLPEFLLIHPKDRVRMLRLHVFEFTLLEDIYHTVEMNYADRLLLVNNTFMAPGICNSRLIGKYSRDLITGMGGDWLHKVIQNCIVPWTDLKVTQFEMLTVRLYAFLNVSEKLVYDESKEVIRGALHNVVKEYGKYYVQECGGSRDACGARMKQILSILGHLRDPIRVLYEICSNIPEFGMLNDWESHMNDTIYRLV